MHRQVLNNTSVGRLVTGHSVNTSSIKGGRFTVPLSSDHVFIQRKLCDMMPWGENIKHLPWRVKFTHTHTHTHTHTRSHARTHARTHTHTHAHTHTLTISLFLYLLFTTTYKNYAHPINEVYTACYFFFFFYPSMLKYIVKKSLWVKLYTSFTAVSVLLHVDK